MITSSGINIIKDKHYRNDDIKILDMNGHLRGLDELKPLKRFEIICMLYVKGCSNEELNALCDKVSRFDRRFELAVALDCNFSESLWFGHLPCMVSDLIDVLDEHYKVLPYVTNLTNLGRYVFMNNLWMDEKYKGKQTLNNFKRIGQDYYYSGRARRSFRGYVLCYGDFIKKYTYYYIGEYTYHYLGKH